MFSGSTDSDVRDIYKEIGDNVRDKQKQSVQGVIDRFNMRNKSHSADVDGKSGSDSDNSGHRREDNQIQGLGAVKTQAEQPAGHDGKRDNERGNGIHSVGERDTGGVKKSKKIQHSYKGEHAEDADHGLLAQAQELEAD